MSCHHIRSKRNAVQKSLTVWALVHDSVPYLPGAQYAGQSPAQLAGVDLQGLPWLQYVNLRACFKSYVNLWMVQLTRPQQGYVPDGAA